jgi:hypothetical protein
MGHSRSVGNDVLSAGTRRRAQHSLTLAECLEHARRLVPRGGDAGARHAATCAILCRGARAFHALQLANAQLDLALERRDALRRLEAELQRRNTDTANRAHLDRIHDHANRGVIERATQQRRARARLCALLKLNPDSNPLVCELADPPPPSPVIVLLGRDGEIAPRPEPTARGTEEAGDGATVPDETHAAGQFCEQLRYLRYLLELIGHYRHHVLAHRQRGFDAARQAFAAGAADFPTMAKTLEALFAARVSLLELQAQAWAETADLHNLYEPASAAT